MMLSTRKLLLLPLIPLSVLIFGGLGFYWALSPAEGQSQPQVKWRAVDSAGKVTFPSFPLNTQCPWSGSNSPVDPLGEPMYYCRYHGGTKAGPADRLASGVDTEAYAGFSVLFQKRAGRMGSKVEVYDLAASINRPLTVGELVGASDVDLPLTPSIEQLTPTPQGVSWKWVGPSERGNLTVYVDGAFYSSIPTDSKRETYTVNVPAGWRTVGVSARVRKHQDSGVVEIAQGVVVPPTVPPVVPPVAPPVVPPAGPGSGPGTPPVPPTGPVVVSPCPSSLTLSGLTLGVEIRPLTGYLDPRTGQITLTMGSTCRVTSATVGIGID